MSKTMHYQIKRLTTFTVSLLLLTLVGTLIKSPHVMAVYENDSNIPADQISGLYNTSSDPQNFRQVRYGSSLVNGGWDCQHRNQSTNPPAVKNSGGNIGMYWISPQGQPGVNAAAGNGITITQGTASVPFTINSAGAYCDSAMELTPGFGVPGDYTVQYFSLTSSRYHIRNKSVFIDGNAVPNATNIGNNDLDVNFNQQPNFQANRFAKNPADLPFSQNFTLSKLANLKPGVHTVALNLNVAPVNYFASGYNGDPNRHFVCVINPDSNPRPSSLDDSSMCQEFPKQLVLNVTVIPQYDATCSIDNIAVGGRNQPGGSKLELSPGQSFDVTFTVTNTGASPWTVGTRPNQNYVVLGSANGADWGAGNQLAIPGTPFGGYQVLVERTGRSTFTNRFTTNATLPAGATPPFSWNVQRYPDGNTQKSPVTMAGCEVKPEVKIRANQPFLRVNGNDVVSGETFGIGANGLCNPASDSAAADNAAIKTNGYSDDPTNGLSNFSGYSSSQYATFASGEIGDKSPDKHNNFMGNSGNMVTVGGTKYKDLLFANKNVSGGTYGHFYSNQVGATPCLDTSAIQAKLPAATPSGGFAGLAGGGEYTRYSGNLTIPATGNFNAQKIIWVDGLVTINGSITYANNYSYDANGRPQVPYLMIIATGGIEVNKAASQIDGNYVSLPISRRDGVQVTSLPGGVTNKSGRLDTCADAVPGLGSKWPTRAAEGLSVDSCKRKLTINGSLVARRILWKGTFGTLADASAAVDPGCVVANGALADPYPGSYGGANEAFQRSFNARLEVCSSEFVNFNAEAFFGPFNRGGDGAVVGSVPDSSIELPPIY